MNIQQKLAVIRLNIHHVYMAYVLVILLGLCSALSFAPYRLYWLMPINFVLLLTIVSIHRQRSVLLAYLWGLSAYTIQNYWINTALHETAGLPQILAFPLTLLLPAYLALYPALCFYLLRKLKFSLTIRLLIALPLLWTVSEYARENFLTGFGWGALGYSQIAESSLAGYAPLGGVALVTYVIVFVSCLIFWMIINRHFVHRFLGLIAIMMIIFCGHYLSKIQFTEADGTIAKIALVQGNIQQHDKFMAATLMDQIAMYYHHIVALDDVDIIILPEGAIPTLRQDLDQGVIAQFASAAKRNGTAVAMGTLQYTPYGTGYQNAVISLLDYDGDHPDDAPFYAKRHLVPFGEYRPLHQITDYLYSWMSIPYSSMEPGQTTQNTLALANQKIAFNICYEDSFGDELITLAKNSSLLANISNMAWYGHSHAMDIQLQHSQARALELGRYMVRATNNGMTAVISPQGKIVAMIPRDVEQVLKYQIAGFKGQTPYMQMNGSFKMILVFSLIIIALFLISYRNSIKN